MGLWNLNSSSIRLEVSRRIDQTAVVATVTIDLETLWRGLVADIIFWCFKSLCNRQAESASPERGVVDWLYRLRGVVCLTAAKLAFLDTGK